MGPVATALFSAGEPNYSLSLNRVQTLHLLFLFFTDSVLCFLQPWLLLFLPSSALLEYSELIFVERYCAFLYLAFVWGTPNTQHEDRNKHYLCHILYVLTSLMGTKWAEGGWVTAWAHHLQQPRIQAVSLAKCMLLILASYILKR